MRTLEAREQWKAGELEAAASLYRSILRDRPAVSWPLILIRQFPENADLWYLLGRVESDRANVDAALQAYALDRLPAWRQQTDPAAPSSLSGEEADLLNLYAAAALAAHARSEAERACMEVTNRQGKRAQLDRLCHALIAHDDGRDADARRLLAGYLPPASEHEWLTRGLVSEP